MTILGLYEAVKILRGADKVITMSEEQIIAIGGKCTSKYCDVSLADILHKALCDNLRCTKGEIACFDRSKVQIRKQLENRMESIHAYLSDLPYNVFDVLANEPNFDNVYSDDDADDAPSTKRPAKSVESSKKRRVRTENDTTSSEKALPLKSSKKTPAMDCSTNKKISVHNEASVASPHKNSPKKLSHTKMTSSPVKTSETNKAEEDIVSEEEEVASNHDHAETYKDKEDSDKEDSDKEDSADKEDSDKEDSADKEDSDKEDSDKEDSDKEDSDKEDSDKEDSDHLSLFSKSDDSDTDSEESASECN